LTRTLVRKGWVVTALDISSQKHLAQKLSEDLGNAFDFMVCDVANYQSLAKCFSATFARRGRIDAFCSNAGIVDKSSIYVFANRGKTE
jgi:NAD(P)-dependent dehydrogenase (short-subunit alcohol dehydrogenase family)